MCGPGILDHRDIEEMGEKALENTMEQGEIEELEEYSKEFIRRSSDRDDYRRIAYEILEEENKDLEFRAEFALRLNEHVEERIEYLKSDTQEFKRKNSFTLGGIFDYPEKDMRETYDTANKNLEGQKEKAY